MSKRTGLDAMDDEHSEFERALLASARADGPTFAASERAWLALEADASSLATLALPRIAPNAARPWSASPGAQALKWLLLGAVGGGALVALWNPLGASAEPPPLPVARAVSSAVSAPALAPIEIQLQPQPEPAAPARMPAAGARLRSRSPQRADAPPGQSGVAARSRLADEVAALDAARTSLAIGANARVLQQIEQYHREFPDGALEADADVVAIEALAAEGSRAELAHALQRFLRRHPRDPHVARIRELEDARLAEPAATSR